MARWMHAVYGLVIVGLLILGGVSVSSGSSAQVQQSPDVRLMISGVEYQCFPQQLNPIFQTSTARAELTPTPLAPIFIDATAFAIESTARPGYNASTAIFETAQAFTPLPHQNTPTPRPSSTTIPLPRTPSVTWTGTITPPPTPTGQVVFSTPTPEAGAISLRYRVIDPRGVRVRGCPSTSCATVRDGVFYGNDVQIYEITQRDADGLIWGRIHPTESQWSAINGIGFDLLVPLGD